MVDFFFCTAWPMKPPTPYSWFHLLFTAFGVSAAVFFARFFYTSKKSSIQPAAVLFSCGLFLAVCELYKQGFLYIVVNHCSFDWWYFPFQLCSVPMYLCLLFPFLPNQAAREISGTFLQDFGLLGGIMALIAPEGLMHPYWTLTLHGFLWHFLLIFIGLYCFFFRINDLTFTGFLHTLPLFFLCCLIATGINVWAGPSGNADMFYISPYYPSLQAVFHTIALSVGILPGNLLYLASVCGGAGIIHRICSCIKKSRQSE